MKTGGQGFVH